METRYFEFGPFRLDSKTKTVLRHGKAVPLNGQAVDVLITLVGRRGAVVHTDELLRTTSNSPVGENNLIQNIAILRDILAQNPEHSSYIEELPSDGYRFIGPVRDVVSDTSSRGRVWRAEWVIAGGVMVLLGFAALWLLSRTSADLPLTPVPIASLDGVVGDPSFSPEGDRFAFSWSGEKEDKFDIYVKLLGPGPPLRLTSHPGIDFSPAWSPDGKEIAFVRYDDGLLDILLVPAMGGPERKVGQLYASRYQGTILNPLVCWSHDGKSLVVSGRALPTEPATLFSLAVADGHRAKITSPAFEAIGDFGPAFSPDGRSLAFCRMTHAAVAEIYVGRMGPDLKFDSAPKPITFDQREAGSPVWSADGKEIIFVSTRLGSRTTMWRIRVSSIGGSSIGTKSKPVRMEFAGDRVNHPAVSALAHRLAFVHQNYDTNIWKVPLTAEGYRAGRPSMVIGSPRNEFDPDFSPDGKRVAFLSDRSGYMEVWISDADGSDLIQFTNFNGADAGFPKWSPDGKKIAFHSRVEGKAKIYVKDVSGGKMVCLTSGLSEDLLPSWSHDGQWIYYTSKRGGDQQVWKMRADGTGATQITRQGGFLALESTDGKTLYYTKYSRPIRLVNTPLWEVPVNGGDEKQVLDTGPVFSRNFAVTAKGIYYMPPFTRPSGSKIQFFRFSDRSLQEVTRLTLGAQRGMALAPDGRTILYTKVDHHDSELLMVENFR